MTASGRLLLVDDEGSVLDLLAEYFVERGYAVTAVATGEKALAAFTRERPDIVLLDIRMTSPSPSISSTSIGPWSRLFSIPHARRCAAWPLHPGGLTTAGVCS